MNADPTAEAKSLADLQEQARNWWVRVNGGNMDAIEQSRLQTWLNANPLHQSAFEDINSLWRELDGIKDLISDVIPVTKPKPRRTERWQWSLPALAACLLVSVLYPTASIKLRADESTGIAETRTVQLADGSSVEMNSESALSINLTPTTRELNLLQGEAQFKVSPDPNRPFQVRAGKGVVTALGTVFNVRHSNKNVEVSVTEHSVAVKLDGNPATQTSETIVAQGQQVAYNNENGLSSVKTVDSRALVALKRQHHLTFETGEWIFLNPNTGKPFIDDRPMRRWIWTPTLRHLGLRHRACYQPWHTYATLMLMSGANPAWAASN
jgi:transmembrane sensor